MKKTVAALLLLTLLFTLCSCSMYGLDEQEASTTSAVPNIVIVQDTTFPTDNTVVDTASETQSVTSSQPQTTSSADNNQAPNTETQPQTTTNLKTYYTDDPNNKYIVTVSNTYGVDAGRLVAFVRQNSSTPGATVLQFKGNKDANGKLITTAEELEYVYDVLDNGKISKSNKDGTDVQGYNQLAGRAAFALVEKYIMPDIEKFKRENRLDG